MCRMIDKNAFKEFEVREAVKTLAKYCEKHDDVCSGCYFFGEYGCKLTAEIPQEWPEVI